MKPLERQAAKIHGLSHEGRGVAVVANKTVFIENALPNEEVVFEYRKRSRRFDIGMALEILTPSEKRVTPQCGHFNICGGCTLQHMEASAQIAAKEKILLEHLAHFGKITPEKILPPKQGSMWGYRRKARIGVKFVIKKGELLIGFREKHSNKIADLNSCETLHPSVARLIPQLKTLIQTLDLYQSIPQIEVAIGDEETALIFRHLESLSEQDQQILIEFAKETSVLLYLQPKGADSIHLLWPEQHSGLLNYSLPEFSVNFMFHPSDFTQVNAEMNQWMVKQAVDLLEPDSRDTILDLFCGLGNFSLPLARFAKRVVGVEGSEKMVERASQNAKHNGLTNVEFYAGNLENALPASSLKGEFNKILLDPPRTGAYKMMECIPDLKVNRIVYVSCNPATLARDVGLLKLKGGFQLKTVQVLDMFPHTSHVESMALLQR